MEHLRAPGAQPPGERPRLELCPLACDGDHVEEGVLVAPDGRWWWVAAGVPRMLPVSLYRRPDLEGRYGETLRRLGLTIPKVGGRSKTLEHRTIDRFGSEWLMFRDWGWHEVPPQGADAGEYQGGLVENTRAAFRSKTFLEGRVDGRLCLDAGCGNGRFTRAALECGAKEVIAVDLGWGVDACHEHHRADPRVHVVQASLFELPLEKVDAAFSIGVLMHTGDARRALASIASIVAPGGPIAVRMYHRGNWAYELTDRTVRAVTTRLPKGAQVAVSRRLAAFGRHLIRRDGGQAFGPRRMRWYQVFRNWPTVHHNLDWWSAPVASHHTSHEVCGWGRDMGLTVVKSDPADLASEPGFWGWPEALTVLFERPVEARLGARVGEGHNPAEAVGRYTGHGQHAGHLGDHGDPLGRAAVASGGRVD